MNCNTIQRPIKNLCRRLNKEKIRLNPAYQREAVWRLSQERLLIDSVFMGIDIPKIYVRELDKDDWEVVDGQQRLRAILKFYHDGFTLGPEASNSDWAKKKFSELDEDLQDDFESYSFDIAILRDVSDGEVEEMFCRMQNGTTLNAAEKRNAIPGGVNIFVKKLAVLPFFKSCNFSDRRFAYHHVAAQMLLLEIKGEPCYITNTELVKMYEGSFSEKSNHAKNIKKVLDILHKAFPDKIPELDRHNVISLFLLFRELLGNFVIQSRIAEISDWFVNVFEKERMEDKELPTDERNQDLLEYQTIVGHSSDKKGPLLYRHNFLMEKLFENIQDIVPLDPKRNFSPYQRAAIYRRDGGYCQLQIKCKGEKCDFGSWEADHKIPHTKGGETTVANGQVACVKCNRAKSDKTP